MTGDEHYTEAERLAAEAAALLPAQIAQAEARMRLARLHVDLAHYACSWQSPGVIMGGPGLGEGA